MTEARRPLIGISTGVLTDKMQLENLLCFEPDIIELYNFTTSEVRLVERFCSRHGIATSLHVPTPYDEPGPLRRFCPTGPDERERALALRLTLDTIGMAHALRSSHIVVHFPTPYADAHHPVTDVQVKRFFDPVYDYSQKMGVKVLVENLTAHPHFRLPEHYGRVLDAYPGIDLCFDAGHAFMLDGRNSIDRFIDTMPERIFAVHLYDVRKEDQFIKSFYFSKENSDARELPLADISARLGRLSALQAVILEPPPTPEKKFPTMVAAKRELLQVMRKR